ncbi:hypothetical protein DM860_009219 [Cuscuta australis]|uniref:Uncharacterized protein n=1 Tax=Cuscuta australis TaxID=267555 RepID=A0A328DA24_9ASTE|nr:hypothetical protein DM860_009219 [Cuscuta australis]
MITNIHKFDRDALRAMVSFLHPIVLMHITVVIHMNKNFCSPIQKFSKTAYASDGKGSFVSSECIKNEAYNLIYTKVVVFIRHHSFSFFFKCITILEMVSNPLFGFGLPMSLTTITTQLNPTTIRSEEGVRTQTLPLLRSREAVSKKPPPCPVCH